MDKKPIRVAVASGKGGVGKSTMTACLAHALNDLGYVVGVLDADLYGPSMPIMLPLDKGMVFEEKTIKPGLSSGIHVISFGFFKQGEKASLVRAPIANAAIHQFVHNVDWSEVDILLIDLPPGTGDIPITLMQTIPIDSALLVTTPQAVSVSDVRKAIEMFQKMDVKLLGIVENMSYYRDSLTGEIHYLFGQGGGDALAREYQIPLLGKIPLDPDISASMDAGYSLFTGQKESICKEIILQIGIEISKEICHDSEGKKTFLEVQKAGPHHVLIDWGGGQKMHYRYSELQKQCPCARCLDKSRLKRTSDIETISEDVTVSEIERMGNYALRFHFSIGCKQGMYTWHHLKNMAVSLLG